MNIVIPMAGRGSRLANWEKNTPKPLIAVAGKPMIIWALESLKGLTATRVIFVALRDHEQKYGLTSMLSKVLPIPAEFVLLDDITEGQLCTVLASREWINSEEDLLIASADTFVKSNLERDVRRQPESSHGVISVANLPGDRWSFVRANVDGAVIEVAEKIRISDIASTGLYYFRSGREFVETGDAIIRNQEKTKGEYYVIPVYQKYIERGWTVRLSHATEAWDMGNPDAIMEFEKRHAGNV